MKKYLIILGTVILTGCGNQQPLTAAQVNSIVSTAVAQGTTLIANGCKIVQPTLMAGAVAASDAVAQTAANVNGVFCAATDAVAAGIPAQSTQSTPSVGGK